MKGYQNINSFFNETYEYAFSPVPSTRKKPTGKLALVLACFALSSSGMTIGVQLGSSMSFGSAVAASLTGNLILFLMASFWGILSCRSGFTSVNLIQRTLGGKVAAVFSVFIILTMIIWVGMNGEWLAHIILTLFPNWPFPVSVTAMLITILCIFFAGYGWKSLTAISCVSFPIIIILTILHLVRIVTMKGGFGFLSDYQPDVRLPFTIACTMVVGNFCMSATTMPDLCRFAKNDRSAVLCVSAYVASLALGNLCGIFIARATAANSLTYGISLMKIAIPSFIWLSLCAYTTQMVNLYTGSLALQSLIKKTVLGGNLSHRTVVFLMGGVSVIVGSAGITEYFSHFTSSLVISVIPLTGLAVTEVLIRNKLGHSKSRAPFIAWLAGIATGCVVWLLNGLHIWTIPVIPTVLFYLLLRFWNARRDRLPTICERDD